MSGSERPLRKCRLVMASALGLVAGPGFVALDARSEERWLRVDPVAGPLPRGSLIVGLQRDIGDTRVPPGGHITLPPEDGATVRIDPKAGAHRDLIGRVTRSARLSPDGRTLALSLDTEAVWIKPIDGGEADPVRDFKGGQPVWSPDGSAFLVTETQGMRPSRPEKNGFEGTWRFTFPGLARARLDLPDTEAVADWSRDGRYLLTLSSRDMVPAETPIYTNAIFRMAPDGSAALRLSPSWPPSSTHSCRNPRFSPDGKRVVYIDCDNKNWVASARIIGIDGDDPRDLATGRGGEIAGACWSPDGRSLVVHGTRDAFIIDVDGSNRRPLGLRWKRRLAPGDLLPGSKVLRVGPNGIDFRAITVIEWIDLPGVGT